MQENLDVQHYVDLMSEYRKLNRRNKAEPLLEHPTWHNIVDQSVPMTISRRAQTDEVSNHTR